MNPSLLHPPLNIEADSLVFAPTLAPHAASTKPSRSLPLRILIDARKITHGGIGRYTASLLLALESEGVIVTALVNAEQRPLLPHFVTPLITHLAPYSIPSFFSLSGQIPWSLFDLYHSPHFFLPRAVPIPSVVTVHDVIPVTHPSGILHQRLTSYMLSRLSTHASSVVTVSRSSAQQLRTLFGIESILVPNILPFPAHQNPNSNNAGTNDRYVVGVFSNGKPHKGQLNFAHACASCGVRGIAVGKGATVLQGAPMITCLSEMPWEELLKVYQSATALVVASEVEGFCLPAMEAKALGVPVVSTPEPAVLELLDENDEVAKDFSSLALGVALRAALRKSESSSQGQHRGAYRWAGAEAYSPQRVAKQLMNVYHKTLGTDV